MGRRGEAEMKINIEVVDGLAEDEVLIRCGRADEKIRKLYQSVLEQARQENKIVFYKQNREFYFPLDDILFFETEGDHIYAHTADDAYLVKYRLYELEGMLPRNFVRSAKSAIVNVRKIYSVTRNLAASSLIQFTGSHKQIYVSRYYYKELRQRLRERGHYET
jgi:DNA-binding LytR/AlgR family response regulator